MKILKKLLKQASTQQINWFYAYEGVSDLCDDLRPGKPEIQVRLKKGAKLMGLDICMPSVMGFVSLA